MLQSKYFYNLSEKGLITCTIAMSNVHWTSLSTSWLQFKSRLPISDFSGSHCKPKRYWINKDETLVNSGWEGGGPDSKDGSAACGK